MNERLSLISELIQLAKRDNQLQENELGFIKAVSESLGISDQQLVDLFENPVAFDPPVNDAERILQFHRLVLLMNVDRTITESEMEYVRLAGLKLGLNPLATNEVLERMYDYPNNVIPPDELIKIFMRHHN